MHDGGMGYGSLWTALFVPSQRGTPCSCRRALWRGARASAALLRPWFTGPWRNSGYRTQATSHTPSWPWTLSPTVSGGS